MKRFIAVIILVMLICNTAGCSNDAAAQTSNVPQYDSGSTASDTNAHPSTVEPAPRSAVAVSVPASTVSYDTDDGNPIFYHTFQTMYLTMPDAEVADKVIISYLNLLDSVQLQADEIYQTAVLEYRDTTNWAPYSCQLLLSPSRIDYGVLSLFGTQSVYSGSGHPSRVGVALSYDLTTGDPLTLGSIMNMDASTSQLCELVLDTLNDRSGELFLYEDYQETVTLKFAGEESLFESFYFTDTGLCFFFDIYEIAPYSAGIISVELPYEKLVGLVHDAYFPMERDLSEGSLFSTPFEDNKADGYDSMTEAILTEGGTSLLLYTDSSVDCIRLHSSTDDIAQSAYVSYAASSLHQSEAIIITGTEEQLNDVSVSYQNSEGTQVLYLAE